MKNEAKNYSNRIIDGILATITPLEELQSSTKMLLADRIKVIMHTQGLNNKELATRMNKNPSEISRWLSGVHNFTVDTLSEIAVALQVPVLAFFSPAAGKVIREVQFSVAVNEVSAVPASFSPLTTTY